MKIQILGEILITVGDPPEKVPTRALGRILAYLSINDGRVDRRELASAIWPDESADVVANRLRVSLSRLRTVCGDLIGTEDGDVWLEPQQYFSDYLDLRDQLLLCFDEVDDNEVLSRLRQLVESVDTVLLAGIEEPWAVRARDSWGELVVRGMKRGMALAERKHEWPVVTRFFSAGVLYEPWDIELWRGFLRARRAQGFKDDGIEEARRTSAQTGSPIPSNFINELKRIRDSLSLGSKTNENEFDESDRFAMSRIIEQMVSTSPEKLLPIIGLKEMDSAFMKNPISMRRFLEALNLNITEEMPGWEAAVMRMASVHSAVYDWKLVIKECDRVIGRDLRDIHRGKALMLRSFAYFQIRKWDDAMSDIRESILISSELGLVLQEHASWTTEGSFLWHQGEFEIGLQRNQKYLSMYMDSKDILQSANCAVAACNNATVNAILGNWEEARQFVDLGERCLRKSKFENIEAMRKTLVGVIYSHTGDTNTGINELIEGLHLSYRRGQPREQQIGLEWACGVLSHNNYDSEAIAVLNWIKSWREKTLHTWSVAETLYVQKIYDRGDCESVISIDPGEPIRSVMAFVIQKLREIQALHR